MKKFGKEAKLDVMFDEALSALELLLHGECTQVSHSVAKKAYETIKAAPIEQKRKVFWDHFFHSWTARLSDFIEKAFQEYVQLAAANRSLMSEEPLQWAETSLRQFLEPRLGHEIKVAHPDPNGTSEMSFAERVTGGQKAHKWITYWIAEACAGEGQNLGDWVGDGEWELDDEAVDSWQAPAWLITSPSQKDQPLEGWLDAATTALEVGLIHFELWAKLKDAIERAKLRAKVDIAASTSPELKQLEIEQHKPGGKKGKEHIARFPSLPDLRWEEVSMAFVSDEVIKVGARKQLREFRFDQIGFKNKKNGKPNRLWFLLKAFAAISGQLSWQNVGSTGMNANQVQSNVKSLRKTLRNFMCIEDDPFYSYRKVKAYKAKFTITGDADVLLDTDNDAPPSDLEKTYLEDINRRS